MRLLLLVLFLVAAVWLIRRALRSSVARDALRRPPQQGELVSCARCGINFPRAEAKESRGALYCSEEHARPG